MELLATEEQRLLAQQVTNFVAKKAPVARLRELRADPLGYSSALWKEMAALGWTGVTLPEAHGGLALGYGALSVVLEGLGSVLAPEPFLSTVLLSGELLTRGGSDAQQARWLPAIAAGEAVVAPALDERGSRWRFDFVHCTATRDGDGWRLEGTKEQVLDGQGADAYIVSARHAEAVSLFLVEADTVGVNVTRQHRVDGRNAVRLELSGVKLPASALLGALDQGEHVLAQATDRALVGLSAEMLGAASRAFSMTIAYLKERQQFGVLIGSFQALQHRAARLYIELELMRSVVRAAFWAADNDPDALPLAASLAKARCTETFLHVAEEAVQLHGGIGMTDEHDIGLYLKRARAAQMTLGDAAYHRRRWAQLSGY